MLKKDEIYDDENVEWLTIKKYVVNFTFASMICAVSTE